MEGIISNGPEFLTRVCIRISRRLASCRLGIAELHRRISAIAHAHSRFHRHKQCKMHRSI